MLYTKHTKIEMSDSKQILIHSIYKQSVLFNTEYYILLFDNCRWTNLLASKDGEHLETVFVKICSARSPFFLQTLFIFILGN